MNCFFQNFAINSIIIVTANIIIKKTIKLPQSFGSLKTSISAASKGLVISIERRWITTNSPPIKNIGKTAVFFSVLLLVIASIKHNYLLIEFIFVKYLQGFARDEY
jgi:hypothetical protein